jgi:hypothetical protein
MMMDRRAFSTILVAVAAASLISTRGVAANATPAKSSNVVLVHGLFADGSEFDRPPGDVSLLPSGYDAWVIGDEAAIVVDFQGMLDYAAGHRHAA